MIKDAIKKLSYCIFPKRCDLCAEVIELDKTRCELCENLHYITGDICKVCGCEKDSCSCKPNSDKPAYKESIAPFYFEDNIVRAIHRLKIYGYKELAPAMGKEIAECVRVRYSDIKFDYITFIPMTSKKEKKRGYNQSKLLAWSVYTALSECNKDLEFAQLLNKIRETDSQRGSSAKERKVNLFGAFDLAENIDVSGKKILLIDDVKTTGSTFNECSEILKGYGADAVYVASLAITKKSK